MEPRTIRIGKVAIVGEQIRFEQEAGATVDVAAGERVDLVLAYEYREGSREKDEGRVALTAHVGGIEVGRAERRFEDRASRPDDMTGFVSVPITAPPSGTQRARFRVEASYSRAPWERPEAAEEWVLEREGDVEVRVVERRHRL